MPLIRPKTKIVEVETIVEKNTIASGIYATTTARGSKTFSCPFKPKQIIIYSQEAHSDDDYLMSLIWKESTGITVCSGGDGLFNLDIEDFTITPASAGVTVHCGSFYKLIGTYLYVLFAEEQDF